MKPLLLLLALLALLPLVARASTPTEWMDARCKAVELGGVVLHGGDTPSMLGTGLNNRFFVAVPQPTYAVGDIVAFKNVAGRLTAHRVTAVKPGFVFTKGDFNRSGDGWIPLADVVGRVVR